MSLARLGLVCVCLCVHVVVVFSQFGFFPHRETRRYGFDQNYFPNPRRLTQTLAGILHFRPGNQDRNQQYIYPFNNVPGISNNPPTYEQYSLNYPNARPNNIRFPDRGRDIPNDYVNFEPSYKPYEERPSVPNSEFNNNNGELISTNNDNNGLLSGNNNNRPVSENNGGLISGNNNGEPVFGNNDNGGLISGNNNVPLFDNNNSNGGFISGNNNARPVFGNNDNGGLISGNNNVPLFDNNNSNGGLISGNNNAGPVFGNNDNGGLISGNDNVPVFDNNNGGLISGNNNGGPVFGNNDNVPVFDNNNNGGLISGKNNGGPVFGNNDNGGLISGNNNVPLFDNNNNNGGLISGNNNGGPVFGNNDNGGLISGNNNGQPVFDNSDNGGLISGNNKDNRPVFGEIEDDGAISSYDDGNQETPSPVMVVDQAEDGSVPTFVDRTGEDDPPAVPDTVPESEPKNNLNFGGQGVFSESCDTIDGKAGSCIAILSCQPYVKLLQQSQTNPEAVRVLRSAHCGFEGNYPKVCCPRPEIPNVPPSQPTPQPQPIPSASPKTVGDLLDSFPEPPVCGVSSASFSRVVGGINATLGDFPWMALLGYRSKRDGTTRWLCGGSLVSPRHVLTAAHCIHNHEEDLYVVRLGELDLARDDEGATPIDVIIKTKNKHEGYDAKSFINDIGILVLDRDVQFTELIRPICIPKEPELRARSFVDHNPIIAGWGDTEFRGPSATLLQVLQLPVVSNEFCAQAYSQYTTQVIDKRVLCAGFKKGGKDACQGDSGGPLMQPIWNSETYKTFFYQIGVVSYGKRCAEAGFPGVYTRVTEFVPWIQKNMIGSS